MYSLYMEKTSKQASKSVFAPGILFVGFIAAFTSLYLRTKTQDPLNLPKFQALMILTPCTLYFIKYRANQNLDVRKLQILVTSWALFIVAFISASIFGGNLYQSLIGQYQRNLGFLTYLCFGILFLVALLNFNLGNSKNLLSIFVALISFEVTYGLIQHFGIDPIKWSNPYSPIIGSFGNPNYQSAFLGCAAIVAFGLFFSSGKILKTYLAMLILCSLFLILVSNSSQGFMSFAIGVGLIILAKIKLKIRKLFIPGLILFGSAGIVGLLGLLNKGPASILYQSSISARGDYWRAGFSMMKSHPFSGVGIERYGDYFGSYRDLNQVRGRSFATYSDNAHNVFIHFGATGGFPLFITAIVLWLIVIYFSFLKLRSLKGLEFNLLLTLLSGFIGFISISLISPENIGFTVWAWVFAGAISGMSLQSSHTLDASPKRPLGKSRRTLVWVIIFTVGVIPSILFSQNLYKADKGIWKSLGIAYNNSGTLEDLLLSIKSDQGYAPREQRYKALAAVVTLGLGQSALSREYANAVLEINTRSIDAYKIIAIGFERENNFKEAIKSRLKYLEFDKYNLENLDKLSRHNLALGNKVEAQSYLITMRKIQAENPLVINLEKDLNS
jgi:O-antigen ligase